MPTSQGRNSRSGRSAKGFVAGLWNISRRLKKTPSYECLTENLTFDETQPNSTQSDLAEVAQEQNDSVGKICVGLLDVNRWDMYRAPTVGYAALRSGVVDTPVLPIQADAGFEGKRTSYFCDQLTEPKPEQQVKDSIDVPSENDAKSVHRVSKVENTDGVAVQKKKSKRSKKKVVFLRKDGEQSLQMKSYVQLEEVAEEQETKKKRKKRRKVTSKKVKKGAKKTGTMAWKGLKLSWKCLKYGLIQISQGPAVALNVNSLSKTYAPYASNYQYDYTTGRRRVRYA